MRDLFFAEAGISDNVSWQKLFDDLNSVRFFYTFLRKQDPYEVFVSLLLSLVTNKPITLLDSDLSNEELMHLEIDQSILEHKTIIENELVTSKDDLIARVSEAGNWKLSLYTSGTTGIPKKITHSFKSITRAVRIAESKKNDVWGFAYNPTHIAGIQVFFQALLNQNPMIYLFGKNRSEIFEAVENYGITNISATPTFFRMLPPGYKPLNSVVRLTSGGEKFDPNLSVQLNKIFPNARLLNVFASTEAGTLFASSGEIFTIAEEMLDKIKILEGELVVHKELMGESESLVLDGDWYKTGDLVELLSDSPLSFRFASRKNELINVGGYKVNPLEVESIINTHHKVIKSRVYGKPNPVIGSLLFCDIEQSKGSNLLEKEIRQFLEDKLQAYKIPRIINFTDHISTTRTGKLKR